MVSLWFGQIFDPLLSSLVWPNLQVEWPIDSKRPPVERSAEKLLKRASVCINPRNDTLYIGENWNGVDGWDESMNRAFKRLVEY